MKSKINKNLTKLFAAGAGFFIFLSLITFILPLEANAQACDPSTADSLTNNGAEVCGAAGYFWNGTACTCPSDSGNLGQGAGVENSPCASEGVQSTCGAGLVCDCNHTCQVPNTTCQNGTTGGTTGGTSGGTTGVTPTGGVTCPSPLVASNGLCLPPSTCSSGICSSNSLSDLILKVIQLLLAFAGIIAVVFLVLGGFWYITSAGNEEQAEKGRKALVNAIIGLVVVILAYTIVAIVAATLNGADKVLK